MIETAAELIEILKAKGWMLAAAESCTGGKLAAELVAVPGASDILFEGLVTYANEAKKRRLGVKEETLGRYGAVSPETAREMAEGLLTEPVRFGIATTGIAGPGGGTADKPVGLVFIGVAALVPKCSDGSDQNDNIAIRVTENRFSGTREEIREQAKDAALILALDFIKNQSKE